MPEPPSAMGELFIRWAAIVVGVHDVKALLAEALNLLAQTYQADEAEFLPTPESMLEPLYWPNSGGLRKEGAHAQYSIPLFIPSNQRNFGIIRLIFLEAKAVHGAENTDQFLTLFGEVVATQVERFLGREKEVKESQLHRALAEAAHLLLFMGPNLGEIATVALEDSLRLAEFKKGMVLVLDREKRCYEIKAQSGMSERQIRDYHDDPWRADNEPLALRLLKRGDSVGAADLGDHAVLKGVFAPDANDFLCLPLGADEQVIGCIIMGQGRPIDQLDSIRLGGVRLYADLVAMALRNAMLYLQIELKNRDIEAKTQSLFHYEKLALAGKMAAAVAHQVRNPLSVMGARMQLLLEARQLDTELSDEINLYLAKISEVDGTIRELMDLGRPIVLNMKRQSVLESVRAVASFIEPRCKAKQVQLRVQLPDSQLTPDVWFDEGQFQRCLLDLCLNSLAELRLGGRLFLAVQPEGFWLKVLVEDDGQGVPDAMKSKVFLPFFTTKAKGSGLGLFNVQRICHAMGAEIQVEDANPHGARFVVGFVVTQEKPAPLLKMDLGQGMAEGGGE